MSKYRDRLPPGFYWRGGAKDSKTISLIAGSLPIGHIRAIREGWMASFGSELLALEPSSILVPDVSRGQAWLSRALKARLIVVQRALGSTPARSYVEDADDNAGHRAPDLPF